MWISAFARWPQSALLSRRLPLSEHIASAKPFAAPVSKPADMTEDIRHEPDSPRNASYFNTRNPLIYNDWPYKNTKSPARGQMNGYRPLSENALRQTIDSFAVFDEHRRVWAQARVYAGGMYWKARDQYVYLVATTGTRQKRLGPRSPATEQIYESFRARKAELETRLKSLRMALQEAERLNKALRLGHVPAPIVALLAGIEKTGYGGRFTVVGARALHAFEAAAGVRISQDTFQISDAPLPSASCRLQFLVDDEYLDVPLLSILRRADASFCRKRGQPHIALNRKGFEVECFRAMSLPDGRQQKKISTYSGDVRPATLHGAELLACGARIEHVVIATTGRMATMRTPDPKLFIDWARHHELFPTAVVQTLLDDRLLVP
ncbi:GSU2403 family nucleotidyltransferase fold protein [Paraburkholderia sp. 22B1P]|uniref:GSU2403 family nucleotidyltransferase fold protein n=1 Tax=Paraburkholderia sp. 22B1P TaxID=3080498 RepID=UPI00308DB71D|nr:GSU2403 family nucleotidyltransferase fold protein [Paraburkholderia sp. 22B1P]